MTERTPSMAGGVGCLAVVLVMGLLGWWGYTRWDFRRQLDVWQAVACRVTRVELKLFGNVVCRRCAAGDEYIDWSLRNPVLRDRMLEIGGREALLAGVEICE